MIKRYLLIFVAFIGIAPGTLWSQDKKLPNVEKLIDHPRILLIKNEEKLIQSAIAGSPVWNKMHQAILKASDDLIDLPPLERIQIGRRLLDKSREAIRRIFHLSYAWRLTGDEKYFQRAEKEMLAISKFSDWNPTHFLDVAEMTMAMAIGYDWLYDKLSAESKQIIREAILKKGLEPSLNENYNSWLRVTHNWNQVCNAGMTYGALAIWEDYPDLSKQITERALNTIHLPMNDYKPDGAYPEGYGYWGYGTSFNVLFLSAVEKVFSSDFGLTSIPGFLNTGKFMENMAGVTGLNFNWGDAGLGGGLKPAMFWFAQKKNDPSLLWVEKTFLQREDFSKFTYDRLLPAIMIWGKDIPLDKIVPPTSKVYVGQGPNPVSLMRTSWTDPNGIYLGFKTGSPSVNHGHMDIGSFVMESDGVRWASDFGMQDYESLESKGIKLFGRTQDAQRWTVFRLNNYVHNTLTINHQLQLVKGYAKVDSYSDKPAFTYAISDLSTVYDDQLASVKRGVGIIDEKYVVVRDELTALDTITRVRWTMLTTAEVTITGENTATLKKDGKQLFLRVDSPSKVTMKTWSTEPTTDYDAPNTGTILVGFEAIIHAGKKETLNVLLIPGSAEKKVKGKIKPLQDWK
jgi:hypothetical protein